jgi:hypothetical protein
MATTVGKADLVIYQGDSFAALVSIFDSVTS